MQASLNEKQAFLYKSIIEGGYNPEQFQEYLISKNAEAGDDLNAWPMPELQSVVNEFIKSSTEQKQEFSTPETKEGTQSSIKEANEEIPDPPHLLKGRSNTIMNITKHEQYTKTVKCPVINKSTLYNQFNDIHIKSFDKKEGGLFQKAYIMYKVEVGLWKNTVQRRYSDFEWLREVMGILHPGLPLPPIAKKGKMRKYDDKHLTKRMYILEKFLNKMNQIPEIRADETFENFLKLSSGKEFEKQKAKFKKIKQIPLEKVQTLTGELSLTLDPETNTFNSRAQQYTSAVQPEVKKIYKDFKGAASMLENCSAFLNSVANNCQDISTKENKFRKEAELPQKQNNVFAILGDMARKYSEVLVEQAKMFRKEIYALVKFESKSMVALLDDFGRLSKIQLQFFEKKSWLVTKKEKLFQEGNQAKWGAVEKISSKPSKQEAFEVMLPKQTKEVMKLRDDYALINSQIAQELRRNYKCNNEYLSKYLEQIAQNQSDSFSRGIMIWADVLTRIKSIREQLFM